MGTCRGCGFVKQVNAQLAVITRRRTLELGQAADRRRVNTCLANVGALVEGQLKLFLSAYYKDYVSDAEAIRKKGAVIDPDVASLESLACYSLRKSGARTTHGTNGC